jgi:hypothetical protein
VLSVRLSNSYERACEWMYVRIVATVGCLTALTTELGGKRLELLKEAVPKLSRVAVLYDPADPPSYTR